MSTTYVDNTASLQTLLDGVNGKRQNTVEVEDIDKAIAEAEATLAAFGVRKEDWKGNVSIIVNPHRNRQPKAKSYKFTATATNVVVGRNSIGWYVSEASASAALYPTIANRRNFFLNVPADLLNFEEVKTALGIRTI